jgi:hypothetical protein
MARDLTAPAMTIGANRRDFPVRRIARHFRDLRLQGCDLLRPQYIDTGPSGLRKHRTLPEGAPSMGSCPHCRLAPSASLFGLT